MAKRVFTWSGSFTASAHGSAATAYMALRGGPSPSTQIIDTLEFEINGMMSSSTLLGFMLAYSSTIGVGASTLVSPGSDGPMVVNATALSNVPVAYFATGTTNPTPSNSVSLPKLSLGCNGFAGIVRWNAAPTQQWTSIGNVANGGESVMWNSSSHLGVTGSANVHWMYEPY